VAQLRENMLLNTSTMEINAFILRKPRNKSIGYVLYLMMPPKDTSFNEEA